MVGWSVCHNFLKRRKVTHTISYRSTIGISCLTCQASWTFMSISPPLLRYHMCFQCSSLRFNGFSYGVSLKSEPRSLNCLGYFAFMALFIYLFIYSLFISLDSGNRNLFSQYKHFLLFFNLYYNHN